MTEHSFQLERFYFGVFDTGQPDGKPAVLARTPRISPVQVNECLQIARLDPPSADLVSDNMRSSMGLFRGDKSNYVLAISQTNIVGMPQILFILIPTEAMRWLGGNLQPFYGFGSSEFPTFDRLKNDLAPLTLNDPTPADPAVQSENMLELVLFCQDNFRTVEGLLTTLIMGLKIAVINAPANLEKRLQFVEGLMSLLPVPARVGITFATHVRRAELSLAQIKFLATTDAPPEHVVFNWETGELTPAKFEKHDYARFIISQLRLDPSKVVEQTDRLARTAVWRAVRKDSLANALYWASRRARIDSTVLAGQPVDRDVVINVLQRDPTLPDDLRATYTRHLLSLALPLKDWPSTEIIPVQAATYPDAARVITELLNDYAQGDQAATVFELINYWLAKVPQASHIRLQEVLHSAALGYLQQLIDQKEFSAIARFINHIASASADLQYRKIAGQVAELTHDVATHSPPLTLALLILSAYYRPSGDFLAVADDEALFKHFPPALQQVFKALNPYSEVYTIAYEGDKTSTAGILTRAANSLPEAHQTVFLARLVEAAVQLQRFELVDEHVLRQLLPLASQAENEHFQTVINYVIEDFSKPERVRTLGKEGIKYLPFLYFTTGRIGTGIGLLEFYQNNIFTADRLREFTDALGNIFYKSQLSAPALNKVMREFEQCGLRSEAKSRALCAALMNKAWSPEIDDTAQLLTGMLFNEPRLVGIIRIENTLRLLEYHAQQRDVNGALRTANALTDYAQTIGNKGPDLMVKIWEQLVWDDEMVDPALDLLRRYIRQLPYDKTADYPEYLGQKLGEQVLRALQSTHVMRVVMANRDIINFAEDLRLTAELLFDLATTYHESKERPGLIRLRQDMDAMSGGLSEDERLLLAHNTRRIADLIFKLGKQQALSKEGRRRSRTMNIPRRVLEAGQEAPQSPIDFMRWLGSYFMHDFITDLHLERQSPGHVLGNRSVTMYFKESIAIVRLLNQLEKAFPEDEPPNLTLEDLRAEMNAIWASISLYQQRQIEAIMAEKPQEIAILLRVIASNASQKALDDSSQGRQLETGRARPQSEIEALRWISGYFYRQHK